MIIIDKKNEKLKEITENIAYLNNLLDLLKNSKNNEIQTSSEQWIAIILFAEDKLKSLNLNLTSNEVLSSVNELLTRMCDCIVAFHEGTKAAIESFKDYIDVLLTKLPLIVNDSGIDLDKQKDKIFEIQNETKIYADRFTQKLEETTIESKKHLESLSNLNQEGKNQVQILAGKVLNNDYQNRANAEWEKSQTWTRWTTILAILTILCIIAILVYQLIIGKQEDFNFQFLGTKFLIVATLGLIAKWTSKRATRHLSEEAKYHRLAVNMATIKPFTDALSAESKDKVLSDLALKIFSDGTGNETSIEYESSSSELIKSLLSKSDK